MDASVREEERECGRFGERRREGVWSAQVWAEGVKAEVWLGGRWSEEGIWSSLPERVLRLECEDGDASVREEERECGRFGERRREGVWSFR